MARNRQLEQLVAHYEQSSPTASSPDQSSMFIMLRDVPPPLTYSRSGFPIYYC